MIPNLFILSSTGEVLIEKQWIGRHKRSICDLFWEESSHPTSTTPSSSILAPSPSTASSSSSSPSTTPSSSSAASPSSSSSLTQPPAPSKPPPIPRHQIPPILLSSRYTFVSIYRSSLTFLTACSVESPPLFVLEFLQLVADTFLDYFNDELTESTLRDHFATAYQLLDEMVDGGYTSTTELNLLKDLIIPPSLANKVLQAVTSEAAVKDTLPSSAVSKIPWRKGGVQYVQNEIYFDLNESVDAILTASGSVVMAAVYGEVQCNCRLSGMPDLTLSFTRPSLLDDASLHRCVRINRYQRERVISFVPPDGPFRLLSYKVTQPLTLPLYIKPQVSYRAGSGRIHIMVGSKLHSDKAVINVVLTLPLPSPVRSHTLAVNTGSLTLDGPVVKWDIGKLPKDLTPMLDGNISLTGGGGVDDVGVISAEWQVKMYAVSGLKVEGLAIRNVGYKKPYKGVRSVTQAGRFQVRCAD